jgi:outer membrane protein insertion porin family/translocation and assembly module TamA
MQAAGLGGDARDVKIEPEVRGYIPVSRKVTLAARANLGFAFPGNYGGTIEQDALYGDPCGDAAADAACRQNWVRDLQITFLRGFFSGGASSNRGYGPREVGPYGTVPFFSAGQTTSACANDPASCELPLGGFTLWEASLELRFPISGPLTGVTFLDASDVSAQVVDIRLNHPHLSAGFGARIQTPVGPVRFDFGYRIPGLQHPNTADENVEPTTIWWDLPIAVSFGIGEAF